MNSIYRNSVTSNITEELNIKLMNAESTLLEAKIRVGEFLIGVSEEQKDILSRDDRTALIKLAIEKVSGYNLNVQGYPGYQEEHFYSATSIGKELCISAIAVGKLASLNDMKTPEYGALIIVKFKNRNVEVFRYNDKGRAKLIEMITIARDAGILDE